MYNVFCVCLKHIDRKSILLNYKRRLLNEIFRAAVVLAIILIGVVDPSRTTVI